MGKCNVRHHGNGIVARLPTQLVHAVDHLLHEYTQLARLIAFSLSPALAADANGDLIPLPFWLTRGTFLSKLAEPVSLALKPVER